MTGRRDAIAGWVLFDDACGVCRRMAAVTSKTLRRRGFVVDPLQSAWVGSYFGMSEQELLKDVRLISVGGTTLEGADVYRFIMKRFWWGVPISWLSSLPVFSALFDRSYRMFADHRHLFSRSCATP